jgi:hypothetical protein
MEITGSGGLDQYFDYGGGCFNLTSPKRRK